MNTQAVIATTPTGMAAAQAKLITWMDEKLATIADEFKTTEAMLAQLRIARMATNHAERILDSCRRRERFYTKVRAALEAGYYIIPPFDCQVFAIRTDRESPPENVGRARHLNNDAKVRALPPGLGDYVHPVPEREFSFQDARKHPTEANKVVTEDYYRDTEWKEVEFPVRAMKPELLEATREAMELRIFDTLGIAPYYRQADPIIVGRIKHYKAHKSALTFFIAWWLDREDL